jgi:hypothetical protein
MEGISSDSHSFLYVYSRYIPAPYRGHNDDVLTRQKKTYMLHFYIRCEMSLVSRIKNKRPSMFFDVLQT